jgi:hypothetical protein
MGKKKAVTVFESSDELASPSGDYSVCVSSRESSPGSGVSQAMVSEPQGGSGLIAFYSPRVSMGFVWKSDHELVVRYPRELPAPRIDATNSSFGLGGKGTVTYEAVPQSDIEPLRWTREGALRTLKEKRLERGVLLTVETNGSVEHSYSYYDVNEPDSSADALEARGFQGGGYSWAGIVHGLVALRAPELLGKLELDPEGDGLAVRSTNRAALVTVAKLVAAAKRDETLLTEAIERARRDGEME